MNVGQRFALKWKHAHRLEAEILALEPQYVVCEVEHRCPPTCEMLQRRQTLPIEGRVSYLYREFSEMYEPMAEGAIALPSGQ